MKRFIPHASATLCIALFITNIVYTYADPVDCSEVCMQKEYFMSRAAKTCWDTVWGDCAVCVAPNMGCNYDYEPDGANCNNGSPVTTDWYVVTSRCTPACTSTTAILVQADPGAGIIDLDQKITKTYRYCGP
jgi:hypothetical protein